MTAVVSSTSSNALLKLPSATLARPLFLQRKCACGAQSHGNAQCSECRKKQNIVQRKLALGASHDPLEAEADCIAETVIGNAGLGGTRNAPPKIQRYTTRSDADTEIEAPASVDDALNGGGRPLDAGLRYEMEHRFGHDFSSVLVHSGAVAARSARDIDANAYTVGHHIVFGSGRFAPATRQGKSLLAHELTHVVQQSGGSAAPASSSVAQRSGVVQRDDSGGGSTEFEDKVTASARPMSGPGVVSGTVTRTETAPANGSVPRQVIHTGYMNVSFDPADCSITLPFGYSFVQATQSSMTGTCENPPPSTKVPLLSTDRFNAIKAGVLASVNRGLNGWFNLRLSGKNCPGGCVDKALPIRVVASENTQSPDTTITVVNRGGRADSATICAGSWDEATAAHEAGHQVLGVGDEYPEHDERLRATAPEWFRPERVRRDYSKMGPRDDMESRFSIFHERHFNAVKVFIESAFPGCKAMLEAQSRPVVPDFRLGIGGGYASLSGKGGGFFGAGLSMGIPLDRLRRWEFVLGPQFNMLIASDQRGARDAFLLGVRLGLERNTGAASHGFTGGAFVGGGAGKFDSNDYRAGSAGRSTWAPYAEAGLSAGYRMPLVDGSARFNFRLEGALGSAIGAPGVIGAPTPEIESDPQRSRWFRLGVTAATEF